MFVKVVTVKKKVRYSFNSNQLKMVAITIMLYDHLVAVFAPRSNMLVWSIFRLPGGIVAPIMCFLIAVGFHYTSDVRKYIFRLAIFSVISHLPYNLTFGFTFFQATSVFWSLTLGLIALACVKSEKIQFPFKIAIVGTCCVFARIANWHYLAVLWIVNFGLFHKNIKAQLIGFIFLGLGLNVLPTLLSTGILGFNRLDKFGFLLACPFLLRYNGLRGDKNIALDRFFYVFYPAHLIAIYLIKLLFSIF